MAWETVSSSCTISFDAMCGFLLAFLDSENIFIFYLSVVDVPENVFLIEDCPHDWLFPQCSAVVNPLSIPNVFAYIHVFQDIML